MLANTRNVNIHNTCQVSTVHAQPLAARRLTREFCARDPSQCINQSSPDEERPFYAVEVTVTSAFLIPVSLESAANVALLSL